MKTWNNDWNLLFYHVGPKPARIYRDTGEILVTQWKVTWQTTLRSRDLAKIGQIAYPVHTSMGLGIEILWYQVGKISQKIEGEIAFWTFSDLWPISRSGQRSSEKIIPTNSQARYASIMVWINCGHLFLGLHNSDIHLSIFSIIFCHISMTACHMM